MSPLHLTKYLIQSQIITNISLTTSNNNASHVYCTQKCKNKLIGALKVIAHRQNA